MKKYKNYSYFYLLLMSLIIIYLLNHYKNKNYTSHNNEPKIGEKILNNNPSCKHYKSVGTVTKIQSLKNDQGKTVTYKVENDGSTYCQGQTLTKTMDQLTKY